MTKVTVKTNQENPEPVELIAKSIIDNEISEIETELRGKKLQLKHLKSLSKSYKLLIEKAKALEK